MISSRILPRIRNVTKKIRKSTNTAIEGTILMTQDAIREDTPMTLETIATAVVIREDVMTILITTEVGHVNTVYMNVMIVNLKKIQGKKT